METTIHNKLVRDNIPEIISAEGHTPHIRIMDDEEYCAALVEKLREETAEFLESRSHEELADMLEVLLAFAEYHNCTLEQLLAIRDKKRERNGGFSQRIFLTTVDRV